MLLDTGACYSAVSQEFILALSRTYRCQIFNPPLELITATDETIESDTLYTLPIKIGTATIPMTFYVIPRLANTIILGRDNMKKHKIFINFRKEIIKIEIPDVAHAATHVTIPPHQVQTVPVTVLRTKNRNSIYCLAQAKPIQNSKSLLTEANQLISLKKGHSSLCLVNNTDQPIIVHRNQPLATLCSVPPSATFQNRASLPQPQTKRHSDRQYWQAIHGINFSNSVLPTHLQVQLKRTIFQNKSALALDEDIGVLKDYQYKIKLKTDTVFNSAPYRIPPAM